MMPSLTRRDALKGAALAAAGLPAVADAGPTVQRSRMSMKKSINLWAFPYPDKLSLADCLHLAKDAGFEGIELNYDLENDLSPKCGTREYEAIRHKAEDIGIAISGVCSFLYWPYSLTDNDPEKRSRGLELASKMIAAARDLGTDNLLTIAGSVYIPWIKDSQPVALADCEKRSKEAISRLLPIAEEAKVCLNIENIFFNGYLLSPADMIAYIDGFKSDRLRVHFDTGNIMLFQHPEDWVRALGRRIKNVHLKEFSKKGTDFSLESFRTLLDGTTNWPAVLGAFAEVGYTGYLTFEYFHPFAHYPEALIYHTSDALDRMLGRK
jgi:hexulose-6-phosphate isomerase